MTALGCGLGKNFDLSKLRYGRVIILADADSDGNHIATLLLTFIYRHLPQLLTAGKVYLANGKLPQADPMTATDKKAVFEAEEQLQTARQSVENLKLALQESAKAYTGPTAGARGYISSIVGSPAGEATENLHNIVATNAVQSLKSIFGGNPTEGERKILLELAGSVNKAQSVRDEIYRRAIALAERRIDFNQQRVDQLRGGNYYQPQGGPQQPRPQPQTPQQPAAAPRYRAQSSQGQIIESDDGINWRLAQ